jgi:hypothetical protein
MTVSVNISDRRSDKHSGAQDCRRAELGAWSSPLWSHALPAWGVSARTIDLHGHAELSERHDAVRRWRGLPLDTE